MLIKNRHLKLLRRIAWSFHRTTGIELKELFSQACLAYCEASLVYDPAKGGLSKFVSIVVNRELIIFTKREAHNNRFMRLEDFVEELRDPQVPFFEVFESWSEDSQEIAKMILDQPHTYLCMPRKMAKGMVVENLRIEKGWYWHRIWPSIRELKAALKEM